MKQKISRLFLSLIAILFVLTASQGQVSAQSVAAGHSLMASRLPSELVDAFNQQIKS